MAINYKRINQNMLKCFLLINIYGNTEIKKKPKNKQQSKRGKVESDGVILLYIGQQSPHKNGRFIDLVVQKHHSDDAPQAECFLFFWHPSMVKGTQTKNQSKKKLPPSCLKATITKKKKKKRHLQHSDNVCLFCV